MSISKVLILSSFGLLLILSGCEKLSSIPTAEDNFIVVPPVDLEVITAHDASVLLQWNQVGAVGFEYYNLYYGTNRSYLPHQVQTYNNSFYVDSLSYDSTYYFEVTAVYANGDESGPSNIVSAEPINYFHPAAPVGLVVQGHDDSSGKYITVVWSPNLDGDLAGYEVYRGTTSSFQPDTALKTNLITTVTTDAFKDTVGLVPDTEYYYKIIAFDFAHWRSTPSSPDSDMILARPTLVSPSDGATLSGQNILQFTFNQVQGASGYILYISTSSTVGDVYSTTIPPNQNSVIYSGYALNLNEQYFWHIAATTQDPNTPNSVSDVYSFILTQ